MGYSTGGSFWFYAHIEISKRSVHNINIEKNMNLINCIFNILHTVFGMKMDKSNKSSPI